MSFNPTKIMVPAGANITVNFDNQDTYESFEKLINRNTYILLIL